jgi:hypothetical protein
MKPTGDNQRDGRTHWQRLGAGFFEYAAWILAALNALAITLYVIPFYNRWYRIPVNVVSTALLYTSLVAIALILIPVYFYKKLFGRLAICVVVGFLLLAATRHAYGWRVYLTKQMIQTHYCEDNRPVSNNPVLGGIINTGGMFINDSHCLIVICDEEFFYCDREPERQSEQH